MYYQNYNRILYWDDDNRLTKTVDTTSGASVTTQYHYDAKGMRIIKDGPYGKSIYIDTGYVESGATQTTAPIVSNHIFVGNTRVASVVKHIEEKQPATYFYASDHLGSSSVLTTQQGSYHERIEYLPYGETWVEDKAVSDGYTTPYKFTGKELDAETGLYYFGPRQQDPNIGRFLSTDKAFPTYLYGQPYGGIFNPAKLNVYAYCENNPVIYVDPDGNLTVYIWDYKGKDIAWGHASMRLDDNTYISWWPDDQGREGKPLLPMIYTVDAIKDQLYKDDVKYEGQDPDHAIQIDGLNEKAIKDWWENKWKKNPKWETLTRNCSTTVAEGLKAGGGDDYSSFLNSFNLIWKPNDVKDYANSIKENLDKRNQDTKQAEHEDKKTIDKMETIYRDDDL